MPFRLYFLVVFLLVAMVGVAVGSKALGQEISLAEVEGCTQIGPPLSAAGLRKIVPGHIHRSALRGGAEMAQIFSVLTQPGGKGLTTTQNPNFPESQERYWIEADRVCMESGWCEQVARCTEGTVPYVGWVPGSGTGWAITAVEPNPDTAAPVIPVTEVSPKPDYDAPPIAPAADWSKVPDSLFTGFAGLVGLYVAESAADRPVIKDFFAGHDYTTGRKANDGRRIVQSLIRLQQSRAETVTLYSFGSEGGAWDALFGGWGPAADKVDLLKLDPGVVDLMTDANGAATRAHWAGLRVHLYHTYAHWDPATHQAPATVRVMSPQADLFGRAVMICDAAELAHGAPQVSVFTEAPPCRRYNRAFEVTEMLAGKNALQVAAALKGADEPLVMMAGDIGIAGDRITVSAAPVPPLVTINDGRFHGWDAWLEQTRAAGGRGGRRIVCELPVEDAENLATLEKGDLMRFVPILREASDRMVRLECSLP